ncbi:hypothetical protein [Kribbella sp. NBC_00889]|uniref:hypothetical protein n=1 Tax=Kribbella sp. NBC_00889 TaxID=2975974 RepID=UPI003866DE21|nr:hypothetical protein OG817_22620 [Kribbella sp. NBC_00889]
MRASELIQSVDKLPYGVRQRAAALAGRRLNGSTLLDELARCASYERTLGLTVAQAAGDVSYVTALLRDPDPSVQAPSRQPTCSAPV